MTLSCGILQPSRQLFSPKPENDGGRKGEISHTHLSPTCSSFMRRYWRFHVLSPWYLNLKYCKWPGNWAAHEAWLMCLLPPPHPWTMNGSSFAELCLSKAFEMNACIYFPFQRVSIADWLLATPASASWKGCRAFLTCTSRSCLHTSGVTEYIWL